MSKTIWFINDYAGSPYHGMEFRHYYLGKELIKLQYKITIISSSYSHLLKKLPIKKIEKIDGINYLWLKMFNYGSSHDKRRILKWFYFMFKILFLPFHLKKPDVIVVSSIAPFSIFPAWILSKLYKSKLIYEVKDIWPLSLIEIGGFSSSNPFIRLMSWFERFAIKKSDIIVSNLQNYGEHIKNNLKINRDFTWISNGINLDELKDVKPLDNKIKKQIPNDKFIIGYTGTIGVANDIKSFCKSAKILKKYKNILFVIVGNGQEREKLIRQYDNLNNILFIEAIDKQEIQSMLELFDVCFLGWNNKRLYTYGTSANKIFDYMYSSKPILNAFSGGGDIIKTANCGISVEAENSKDISNAILKLYNMTNEEREKLGKNGKQYVLKHFTYEKLAKKYTTLF